MPRDIVTIRRRGGLILPVTVGGGGTDPPGIFGSNLVAWWNPQEDALTGGGTTAPDHTGHGHDLTVHLGGGTLARQLDGNTGTYFVYNFGTDGFSSTPCFTAGSPGSLSFPGLGGAGAVVMIHNLAVFSQGAFANPFSMAVDGTGAHNLDNLNSFSSYFIASDADFGGANSIGCYANNVNAKGSPIADTTRYLSVWAFDSTSLYDYRAGGGDTSIPLIQQTAVGGTMNMGGGAGGGFTTLTIGNREDLIYATQIVGEVADIFVVNVKPSPTQLTAIFNYYHTIRGII